MYRVISHEGNDEARTCQTGISTHSPPLRTTSTNTLCALLFSDPHCSCYLTNNLPFFRRHFQLELPTIRRSGALSPWRCKEIDSLDGVCVILSLFPLPD